MTSTVNPGDGARGGLGLQDSIVDGEKGSGTDTSRQQDERLLSGGSIGGVEEELSLRRAQLNNVPDVVLSVKQVGDQSGNLASSKLLNAGTFKGLFPLDADSVVVDTVLGSFTQTELSALGEIVKLRNGDLQADILSGEELGERISINGLKVEADDALVLGLLLDNLELSPVLPAAIGVVELLLPLDEDVSQLSVGSDPSILDVVGQGIAKNLADGADQVVTNDGVMVGLDEERSVLLSNALNSVRKLGKVVDVLGISKNRVGEGSLLSASLLVSEREVVLQLGMGAEHVSVKGGGDGLAMLLEDRSSGLDDGDLSC